MLKFTSLLREAGIDPAGVRLLRHCDPDVQRQVYQAAIHADPRFDLYQNAQVVPRVIDAFRAARYLAAFVVDPVGDCVFVGLWEVTGESSDPYTDPFPGAAAMPRSPTVFETRRVPELDCYRGRLVIEWGPGQRAWVQRADSKEKPIVELRRQIVEPEFVGYLAFRCGLAEVEALPSTWIAALRAVGGVYLLVHRERAEFYVGSASGADGFFGRWLSYQNGHGGNVGMQAIEGEAADYDVSILETAGSGLDERAVLQLESRWKEKLASRLHGLNRN
ncbi:MAG: GIY-YIG nuclease family protein [Planctomycetes bacterium]|nr:GIY-YIG nuclease family protein [Planctomycetota bacterium]